MSVDKIISSAMFIYLFIYLLYIVGLSPLMDRGPGAIPNPESNTSTEMVNGHAQWIK